MIPTLFQQKVIDSEADIVIVAGGRGCGKKWAVLSSLKKYRTNYTRCAVFSKGNIKYINLMYQGINLDCMRPIREIKIDFVNLHQRAIYDFAGMEYGLQIFNNLHEFSENEFLYLMSRNRDGMNKSKIYATVFPPHAPFWLKQLCSYWINKPEANGELRYFINYDGEKYIWGDSVSDVVYKIPLKNRPPFMDKLSKEDWSKIVKSITVISCDSSDNNNLPLSYKDTLIKNGGIE